MADNQSVFIPALTRSCIYDYLRGLILCWSYRRFNYNVVIYNPTTRQALWLPDKEPFLNLYKFTYFFGYDPLENQYKVLGVPHVDMKTYCVVFTLTVPTATKSWRYMESIGPGQHYPGNSDICINGVIYYQARAIAYGSTYLLMSFDVRYEKFSQVDNVPTNHYSSLINYQGKLGLLCCKKGVEIWVMEHDTVDKTQEWSKIFFHEEMVSFKNWFSSGVTRGGEIPFVHFRPGHHNPDALCITYYDPERNSTRYEDIVGINTKELKQKDILFKGVVTDHVENTMSLY